MYIISGRQHLTTGDFRFMKELGIEPSSLDDPFPRPLPPPPPPEATIPKLTEEDACWLHDLRVIWEQDPEPGFVPPTTLREYLARFPNGIRQALGEVAKEMGLAMSDGSLDDLAREITRMFLDFAALGLEDIVELYEFYKPMRPGECGSRDFDSYIRFRIAACLPVVLKDDPHGDSNR